MATQAQIAANRRNAQKSTGPRTPEGRTTSGQNALRHGLCSKFALIENETNEEVQSLLEALRDEHQPTGPTEEILVYKMAHHFFAQKRAETLIAKQLMASEPNAQQLALYMRYQTSADRGFNTCLAELRKAQKMRKIHAIGLVSQDAALSAVDAEAEVSPAEAAQMWDDVLQNFLARQSRSPEIQAQNLR